MGWDGMGWDGIGFVGLGLGVVGERWARENTYQYLVQSSSSPQRLRSTIMSLPLLVLSGQQLRDASLARRIFGLVFVLHYRYCIVVNPMVAPHSFAQSLNPNHCHCVTHSGSATI
jgi:hypothetical protein